MVPQTTILTTVPFVPTIHRQSLVDKGLLLEENLTPDHTWHPIQISHQKPITITGGERAVTRGQPNSGSYMASHPNQPPKPITCCDFNHNTCRRPDCKFAHCCEHCGANHAVKDCSKYGWPFHTR